MTDRIGQQLGNYRLIQLLGQGGFADVYLGQHLRLNTHAAIKVLHTHLKEDEVKGFQREAQMVAGLLHPHIVRVLDFDVQQGVPFIVMDYAPHGTVRQHHLKGTHLPLDTVVNYTKQVAEALQYAHDKKVIHGDVKPENMLLGENQQVLLSDFGIATIIHNTSLHNNTWSSIAPEDKPCPASDQYALGIVVYEWLCGDHPFTTETYGQHLVVTSPLLREKVLTEVVMTALAKDPKERFETVEAFATALEQAASKVETPTAMQPSPKLVVDTKPVGTIVCNYRGHFPRPVTSIVWSPDGTRLASASLDGTAQIWDAFTGSCNCTYYGQGAPLGAMSWSPDGRSIATGSIDDNWIPVWDVASGKTMVTYSRHSSWWASGVRAVAWSPDGQKIVSGGDDKTAHVWVPTTGEKIAIYRGHADLVYAVAWSPDGQRIASASYDKTVQVWDASRGNKIFTYRGHSDLVYAVAWSSDGKQIASASRDKTVQVWDASTGNTMFTLKHVTPVRAVVWSPDGTHIASGGDNNAVQVWNATTRANIFTYQDHSDAVLSVAWSPDGRYIASADKTVQVWSAG